MNNALHKAIKAKMGKGGKVSAFAKHHAKQKKVFQQGKDKQAY